jgi:hypothetical protein
MHTVVETGSYLRAAAKLMSEAEREEVVTTIAKDPEAGDVIAGTGGFRKLRIALHRASRWRKERRFSRHLFPVQRDDAGFPDADLREKRES